MSKPRPHSLRVRIPALAIQMITIASILIPSALITARDRQFPASHVAQAASLRRPLTSKQILPPLVAGSDLSRTTGPRRIGRVLDLASPARSGFISTWTEPESESPRPQTHSVFRLQTQDSRLKTHSVFQLQTPDSRLQTLIDGLQRKYSRMQGIAADFTQIYQGPDGRVLKESGRVLLKRPRKARWDYSNPERKVFISNGKDIYFYVYGEKEATRTAVRESADPQIPFLFLLGQGNLRRDFSRIDLESGVLPAVPGDIVVRLVPKRAPEDFKELLAEANPDSFAVRRLVISGRNGSRMDFLLSNIRENYVAPDSEFVFTLPPGVILKKAQPQ